MVLFIMFLSTISYCDKFSFRCNPRKVNDAERAIAAIEYSEGKRLSYKPLIGVYGQFLVSSSRRLNGTEGA
jgi:hypothetical protein